MTTWNKELIAHESKLLRLATEQSKIDREEFLKHYFGSEDDAQWVEKIATSKKKNWQAFYAAHQEDVHNVSRCAVGKF